MPFFAAQQSLFRAYDIRGSRQLFTTDFVQTLGGAFAHLYTDSDNFLSSWHLSNPALNTALKDSSLAKYSSTEKATKTTVVIGYDMRFGSDIIAQKLASILTNCGIKVIQLGLVTTPMMIFWAEQYHGHGIILTASHSAKDILGIKWLVNYRSPSSTEIQALYQQVIYQQFTERPLDDNILEKNGLQKHGLKKYDLQEPILQKTTLNHENKTTNTLLNIADNFSSNQQIYLPTEQVASAYITAIAQVFEQLYPPNHMAPNHTPSPTAKLKLRLVIDCMHGATSHIAQHLFERFDQQVIMLNDTPDGSFPLGNPDPTEPNRLKQLQQAVIIHKADIGVAFDGDGDRLMIVDNLGKVVTPDHLLYLLAKIALSERPKYAADTSLNAQLNTQILFDIKCCHHLPKLIADLGATAVMSQTGSSLMRQQMQQSDSQIIFAGELSGHFIFNDSRFIIYDDAMYAALRLLHWLDAHIASSQNSAANLAEIIAELPAIVSTADHYLPLPKTSLTDCSIVEQLTRLCLYLQQLIATTTLGSTHPNDQVNDQVNDEVNDQANNQASYQTTVNCAPAHCTCAAKQHSITLKQAKQLLPAGTSLSCIDGVRLDFARGFGVLRQSNTSHNLTARFAGDSIADLRDIQAKFAALCRPFDAALAQQIMNIVPE